MSSIKKCDRCGHMFDPYSVGKRKFARFQNPAFEDEDTVRQNKVASYLLEGNQYGYGRDLIVDLCPDCTEDFECFMDNYPLALRTNDDPEKVTDGEPYMPPDPLDPLKPLKGVLGYLHKNWNPECDSKSNA